MVLIELLETASGDEETVRMNFLGRLKPSWRRTGVDHLQNNEENYMIHFDFCGVREFY